MTRGRGGLKEEGERDAIVVTPLAVSAPYWSKLLQASVVDNRKAYIRLRSRP